VPGWFTFASQATVPKSAAATTAATSQICRPRIVSGARLAKGDGC